MLSGLTARRFAAVLDGCHDTRRRAAKAARSGASRRLRNALEHRCLSADTLMRPEGGSVSANLPMQERPDMPQPASRRLLGGSPTVLAVTVLVLAAACTAAPAPTLDSVTSAPVSGTRSEQPVTTVTPRKTPPSKTSVSPSPTTPPGHLPSAEPDVRPLIVIDPGHAPTVSSIDSATGLVDSDYENEPEMRDVFDVALLVRAKLLAAGYRVVMTKNRVDDRVSLGQRAAIANNAHAALALSIHDQAGTSGGIGFTQGNNIVYYQTVGSYRETPNGVKVKFTDSKLAATSLKYGKIFQSERQAAAGVPVTLQGSTGYDLGSRGLAPGNIWLVQLLSKVPWIYNEAGGNSAGMLGLNLADKQRYANGLIAAVERCVPSGRPESRN